MQQRKRFKAFISYSHQANAAFAAAFRAALETLDTPLFGLPRSQVFCDQTDLEANPSLWKHIQAALDGAEHFILLASPEAAASKWVAREVEHWLQHGDRQKLLIVLTSGEIVWNSVAGDFDWTVTTALSRILQNVFQEEPKLVDFRDLHTRQEFTTDEFKLRVAEFAFVFGKTKRELVDPLLTEARRRLRRYRTLIAALSLALLIAVVGVIFALVQYREAKKQGQRAEKSATEAMDQKKKAEASAADAKQQAHIALIRLLVVNASYLLPRDPDLSLLLSVEATQKQNTLEARRALFNGVTRLGAVEKFLHVPDHQVLGATFGPGQQPFALVRGVTPDQIGKTKTTNLRLWNLAAGKAAGRTQPGISGQIRPGFPTGRTVRFSPDGRYLAVTACHVYSEGRTGRDPDHTAACIKGDIGIYKMTRDGLTLQQSLAHRAWVEQLAFSYDSVMLVARSCALVNTTQGDRCVDRKTFLWKVDSGEAVDPGSLPLPLPSPAAQYSQPFALGPGGKIATSGLGHVQFLDSSKPQPQLIPVDCDAAISALAFSSEGFIAAGAEDGGVLVVDPARRDGWRQYAGHTTPVASLSFSKDGKQLISSSTDGTVVLHQLTGIDAIARLVGTHRNWVTSIAFSPDGKLLASGGWDGSIRLWDAAAFNSNTAKPAREIRQGLRSHVECVAFSPDGTFISSVSRNLESGSSVMQMWNSRTLEAIAPALSVGGQTCSAFRPSRPNLALDRYGEIVLWDITKRSPRGPAVVPPAEPAKNFRSGWIKGLNFMPTGESLLSGWIDGRIVATDLSGNKPHSEIVVDLARRVSTMAMNSGGTLLAVAGESEESLGWVTLLELPNGRRFSEFPTHIRHPEVCRVGPLRPVVSLAFHPHDPLLVTGSEDAIWIWDVQHSEIFGSSLVRGGTRLGGLAVSPPGNAIAAGYEDGSVILWSLDPEVWRSVATRIANRELTPDERQRFAGNAADQTELKTALPPQ